MAKTTRYQIRSRIVEEQEAPCCLETTPAFQGLCDSLYRLDRLVRDDPQEFATEILAPIEEQLELILTAVEEGTI